jgi:hypothetical protein
VRKLWKTGAGPEDDQTQYLVLQEELQTARRGRRFLLDGVGYVLNKLMIYMDYLLAIRAYKILDTVWHDA